MRIVGIDGGTKRVGVALSDELGITAQPVATLARKGDLAFLERLRQTLGEISPDRFVVGLPLRLDGSEGGAARAARRLAALLEEAFGVPVDLWDERLTSIQAERILIDAGVSRKGRRGATDRIAAAILLQSFLDAQSREPL